MTVVSTSTVVASPSDPPLVVSKSVGWFDDDVFSSSAMSLPTALSPSGRELPDWSAQQEAARRLEGGFARNS